MANEYKIAIHIAGKLEQSLGNAVNGANKTLSGLGKVGGGVLGGINKGLAGLGKATVGVFAATGTAMAAAAKQSVTTGMAFEDAMANTAAIAGIKKNSEEYQKLKLAAEQMGESTSKTAAESADALGYMALAGWDVDTSITALPQILHLSEAAGTDLAHTSDLVTDSMAAMGLEVSDLSGYLDVVAKAQNSSNMSAEQALEGMIKSGGALHNLGVDYTDAATALGAISNVVKGSEAGTAINSIMRKLTQTSGESAKAMEALGISMFDSEGQFVGMEEGLWRVHEALDGMSDADRTAYLQHLGGQYYSILGNLLDQFDPIEDEQGNVTTGWRELHDEIADSGGALDQMRDTKLDTLTGDIDKLTSALEALENKFFEAMNGQLREAVQWLTDKVGELKTAFTEGGIDQFAETLGTTLADAAVKAAEEVPKIVKSIGTVADEIVKAFGSEDTAGKLAVGATTIIDTLSTELFTLAGDIADSALNLLDEFINAFAAEDGVGKLADGASKLLDGISSGIDQHGDSIASAATKIITQLAEALPGLAESYAGMALTIIEQLATAIGDHGAEIGEAAGTLIAKLAVGFVEHLPEIVNSGIVIIGGILIGILKAGGALIAAVPKLFMELWDAIIGINWLDLGMQIVKGIWNGITTLWSSFVDWLGNLSTNETPTVDNSGNQLNEGWYFNGGAEGGENYYNEETDMYYTAEKAAEMGAFSAAAEEAGAAASAADAAYQKACESLEQTGESADHSATALETFNSDLQESKTLNLSDLGITAPEADTSATDGALADLMTQYGEIVNESPLQGEAAGQGFTDGLGGALAGAVTEAQTTATSITSAFNGLYFEMISIGMHIGEGLVQGMNAMIAQVQASAANLANAASAAIEAAAQIGSPSKVTTRIGEFIGEGLAIGMRDSIPNVSATAGSLGGAATDRSSILGGMSVNRGMGGGGSINFSPVINLSGTNLTQGDVQKAMRMSMSEFEKLMAQYQKKRGRVAFA